MTVTPPDTTTAVERVLARVAGEAGALAALRRGVGRPLEESPDSWPYVLAVVGTRRWREPAAHLVLGLYALHHQSKSANALNREDWTLGRAGHVLKTHRGTQGGSAEGVERRFQAILASETVDAIAVHLRGLVTLLRSADIPLDYPRLYRDLCSWLSPERRERVCLSWARDFFVIPPEEREKE